MNSLANFYRKLQVSHILVSEV